MEVRKLENPTLTQKLSEILKQPWNRELRLESLAPEIIEKLRATPLMTQTEIIEIDTAFSPPAANSEDLTEERPGL